MKIPTRNDTRKLPEDMLSEEEIEKMINACEHPRDRAMIGCLMKWHQDKRAGQSKDQACEI